jgi:signal transduction histidine kinase
MWAGLPVRKRWLAIALALLSCTGVAVWNAERIDRYLWVKTGNQEPLYFSVSQIHLAFLNLKTDVLLTAKGVPVDRDQLTLDADVLASRIGIVTQPSEMRQSYQSIPKFEVHSAALVQFSRTVLPEFDKPELTKEKAAQLLTHFDAVFPEILALATDAWQFDNLDREVALKSIGRQRASLEVGLLLVSGMLIYLIVLLARVRREVGFREGALQAEQAAVQGKLQFLGMVSHELRSPLQTILASVDIMELDVQSKVRDQAVQRIRRAALELGVQLRDLLTLARGEAGKLEMRPESFDARALVSELATATEPSAYEKGLSIEYQMPAEPVIAVADAIRIRQVLANLVGNAVKYTITGKVSLSLDQPEPGAEGLVFRVTDTGPGIPNDRLAIAFEPFRRVGDIDLLEGSAGMGLSIVAMVLHHLDGSINVTSEVGKGTTFVVRIPAFIDEGRERMPTSRGMGARVLIIDDQKDIRDSLGELAKAMGFDCDVASSAGTAANLLAAQRYDVVLVDLGMPVKRGSELASETRRGKGMNSETYMIAISAGDTSGEGRAWPFNEMLEKPIQARRLKWAITEGLRKRKLTRSAIFPP